MSGASGSRSFAGTRSVYTEAMAGDFRRSARFFFVTSPLLLVLAAGCNSPYVKATVLNSGTTELHSIEVDYPSASFGIPNLAPGQAFHYKLQLRDAGRMKVEFYDNAEKPHSGTGPYAVQGQQGTMVITIDASGKNVWQANLRPAVQAPKSE